MACHAVSGAYQKKGHVSDRKCPLRLRSKVYMAGSIQQGDIRIADPEACHL